MIIIVYFCLRHVTAFQHSVQSPYQVAFTCNQGQKSIVVAVAVVVVVLVLVAVVVVLYKG